MAATGTTSLMQKLDGELICGVCLELFDTPVMLPCSHNFCKQCVFGIIENGTSFSFISLGPPTSFNCPICQSVINMNKFSMDGLIVNKVLENIVSLYRSCAPVDIFDSAWNVDMEVTAGTCREHGKRQDLFCDSCSVAVCSVCVRAKHPAARAEHRVQSLQEVTTSYQTEIADILTDLKKKLIPLNDRARELEGIVGGVQDNQECVSKQLEHRISSLMSHIRQKQEELKRTLGNEIRDRQQPVLQELEKCRAIKTHIHELMKKLKLIRKTQDATLKLKLMKDTCKQLRTIVCFDITSCLQNPHSQCPSMPSWHLETREITDALDRLDWDHHREGAAKPECIDMCIQTLSQHTVSQSTAISETSLLKPLKNASLKPSQNLRHLKHAHDECHGNNEVNEKIGNIDESRSRSLDIDPVSMSPEQARSGERSFDEIDGEYPAPLVKRGIGLDRNNTEENATGKFSSNKTDYDNDRLKHSLGVDVNNGDDDEAEHDDSSGTLQTLDFTDKVKRIKGRSSFPLDLQNTPEIGIGNDKFNTPSNKFKHSYSDREISVRNVERSFSPSNAEVLAKFVARRKTMSPSVSTPALKALDKSLASRTPDLTRKNTSSPSLNCVENTSISTNSQDAIRSAAKLNGARSGVKVANNGASIGVKVANNGVNTETKLSDGENVTNSTANKHSDGETVTSAAASVSPAKEESPKFHHRKAFSKDSIGINLDVHLGIDLISDNRDRLKRVTEV